MLYNIVVTIMQLVEERKYIVKSNSGFGAKVAPQKRPFDQLPEPKKLSKQ